jgi:hypothetical protein
MLVLLNGEERWKVLRLHVEDQIPLTALAREAGVSTRLFNAGISSTGLVMQARSRHQSPIYSGSNSSCLWWSKNSCL